MLSSLSAYPSQDTVKSFPYHVVTGDITLPLSILTLCTSGGAIRSRSVLMKYVGLQSVSVSPVPRACNAYDLLAAKPSTYTFIVAPLTNTLRPSFD